MFKNRATRTWLMSGVIFFLLGGALTAGLIAVRRDAIQMQWETDCRDLASLIAITLAPPAEDADVSAEQLTDALEGIVEEANADLGIAEAEVRGEDARVIAVHRREGAFRGLFEVMSAVRGYRERLDLVLYFDTGAVSGDLSDSAWLLIGIFFVLALVGFLLVRWMVRQWMAPIHELSRNMEKVRQGELVAVGEEREDEVGELARHFNAIVEGLRSARRQSLDLARQQANIEKFAALGRLSAGVAHEVNNPVGGILTCLETMKDLQPGSDRYQEYLKLVRDGLERIGKIVGQLLRFSRHGDTERKLLDLNTVIEEVVVLSRFHNRDDRVKIVRRHQDVPKVNGAPDLLHQLLLNLMLNAMQAMPEGGTLTLSTWAEKDAVCITVEDTGPGIPEDMVDRIFEPFVTTKGVGVGTGLGLSVALGIVESHGGTITARNHALGGARFHIRLPDTRDPDAAENRPADPGDSSSRVLEKSQ